MNLDNTFRPAPPSAICRAARACGMMVRRKEGRWYFTDKNHRLLTEEEGMDFLSAATHISSRVAVADFTPHREERFLRAINRSVHERVNA